jgi:hypothetical protein
MNVPPQSQVPPQPGRKVKNGWPISGGIIQHCRIGLIKKRWALSCESGGFAAGLALSADPAAQSYSGDGHVRLLRCLCTSAVCAGSVGATEL